MNLYDDELIELGKMLRRMDSLIVINIDFKQNQVKEKGARILGQCLATMKLRVTTSFSSFRPSHSTWACAHRTSSTIQLTTTAI
jgi:hypothetical protein